MKRVVLLLLLTLSVGAMYSQKKDFNQVAEKQRQLFQQYRDNQKQKYDEYRQRQNQQYVDFMRQKWDLFNSMPALKPKEEPPVPPVIYEEPKPEPAPAPAPKPEPAPAPAPKPEPAPAPAPAPAPKPEPAPAPAPAPKPEPAPAPAPKPSPKPVIIDDDNVIVIDTTPLPKPEPIAPVKPIEQDEKIVGVNLYGTLASIAFPKDASFKIHDVTSDGLADAWQELSEDKYNVTIATCLQQKKDLSLCDWAYLQLLSQVSEKQFGDTNEAIVMTAYLLAQSGYKVRLGIHDEKVYLLLASHHTIYNMVYYTKDGEKFYVINHDDEESMYICPAMYENEQKFSLEICAEQKFDYEPSEVRKVKSAKGIESSILVNTNMIAFYNDYPTGCYDENFVSRWANYANTKMEKNIKDNLYPQLQQAIAGKTQIEAVNILLNWVQTCFVYGYDDQVWGKDRAFFPAETLYYPYSDCEDRSILFSRLVRDLLGLDVLLLYYPGHLATAVCVDESQLTGDYLLYNNRKFMVCDPTYINAPAGATMPKMNNNEAKVILLN